MTVSKRLRYEILRRDGFQCHYCGAKPPDVRLTADHVVPVALGGKDDPDNLVAACDACNGGKTSSSPDAPLVAAVSEDALKWAAAMQRAQAAMLADLDARTADRTQFQEWWDSWGYGTGSSHTPFPKDPGWWMTVDQIVGAGLPLVILKDCIDLAMTRRTVKAENKFRYMCGIAWGKLTDMQKAAGSIASGKPSASNPAPVAADSLMEGRFSLARELLDEISDEERAYFLECSDVNEFLDEDEQRTEAEEACEAISSALNSARCNLEWLVEKVRKTFKMLPPEIGEPCLADMTTAAGIGDPLSRMAHEAWGGLLALDDLIELREATAWSAQLGEHEPAEWLEYARALYVDAELSDPRLLVRAWICSRVIAEDKYFPEMCRGRGTHIPDCPARGTHYALIAELKCCGPGRAEDHKGHLVCERHLEQLMNGTFPGRSGKMFSATDFTEVPVPEDVWAAT